MIQELLTYARPQGAQYWQFTNDYALARVGRDGTAVEPTARFWIIKHFTNLTPQRSEALATSSSDRSVLYTAFRKGAGYTLHILNLGAARGAALEGLPDASWQVVETTEAAQYRQKVAVRSNSSELHLDLPAKSLLTLTMYSGRVAGQ